MSSILGFLIALVVVLLVAKLLFKSTKAIVGFLVNAVVGFVVLWVLNLLGLGMTINWLTAAIVGFFGVPGLIVLLILKFAFHIL